MRFGVVVFPGSNCDQDCYYVIKDVLKEPVAYIWHQEKDLKDYDCIILPGGFSYGDYLRTGAVARFSPVMDAVAKAAEAGKLILGICNGFQVLLEAGLLPGAMRHNDSLQFRCHYSHLRVENNTLPFTRQYRQGEVIRMPIAHGEGNYYCDADTLAMLQREDRIVLRYCDADGEATSAANPNGSLENIAGICNRGGNVVGIMPHPERCAEEILGSEDGRRFFTSVVEYLQVGGRA